MFESEPASPNGCQGLSLGFLIVTLMMITIMLVIINIINTNTNTNTNTNNPQAGWLGCCPGLLPWGCCPGCLVCRRVRDASRRRQTLLDACSSRAQNRAVAGEPEVLGDDVAHGPGWHGKLNAHAARRTAASLTTRALTHAPLRTCTVTLSMNSIVVGTCMPSKTPG